MSEDPGGQTRGLPPSLLVPRSFENGKDTREVFSGGEAKLCWFPFSPFLGKGNDGGRVSLF